MRGRNFKLFQFVSVIISALLFFSPIDVRAEGYTEIVANDMYKVQYDACMAHQHLLSTFDWDETYVYPADFGGDYIDHDTLHVLLTSTDAIPKYSSLLKDYTDHITFDVVRYSYNDLYELTKNACYDYMEQGKIVMFCVDVKNNAGYASVTKECYDELIQYSIFTTEEHWDKEDPDAKILINIGTQNKEDASLVGGASIMAGNEVGTIGCNGYYNGMLAYSTCGHYHNAVVGDTVYTGFSSPIGIFSLKQNVNWGFGDYGIVTANSSYTPTSAVLISGGNVTNFQGGLFSPAVGTYLNKFGSISGEAYGMVTQTNATVSFLQPSGTTHVTQGLSVLQLSYGSSTGDDSGGPYRYGDLFCGVHKGSGGTNGSSCYFTPYSYFYNQGFTVA